MIQKNNNNKMSPTHLPHSLRDNFLEIDFDVSMGMSDSQCYTNFFKNEKNRADYMFFRELYNFNKPSTIVSSSVTKIPQVIHQIWVGPHPFPEKRKKLSLQWQKYHPHWKYKLWTDRDLQDFDFSLRDLYNESTNFGQKADLLRYEILYKYGGLYLDIDFECVKPFDELNQKYHFYAGLHPPHGIITPDHPVEVGNALIGSIPGHPIIKETIELVRERWSLIKNNSIVDSNWKVIFQTMYPLRDAIINKGKDRNLKNIVLPATYFFPTLPDKIRYLNNLSPDQAFSQVKPETIAIHHWDESWFYPSDLNSP